MMPNIALCVDFLSMLRIMPNIGHERNEEDSDGRAYG